MNLVKPIDLVVFVNLYILNKNVVLGNVQYLLKIVKIT